MTLQKVGLDDLSTSVGNDQNFLAVDMSPNLALNSNVTTVVCSCPDHCTSSEVEAEQLSPLCSWSFDITSTPVSILVVVLRFPFFLFITSTFSHCLVNVVPLGILLDYTFSPDNLDLKYLCRFHHVILVPLLVKFPDHVF
jgi:hypothetical protein